LRTTTGGKARLAYHAGILSRNHIKGIDRYAKRLAAGWFLAG